MAVYAYVPYISIRYDRDWCTFVSTR